MNLVNIIEMIGKRYQHYNGNVYRVILLANLESTKEDYPITIIYQGETNNKIWCRKLSDWDKSFKEIKDEKL